MYLKKEHASFMNLTKFLKSFIFFGVMLAMNFVSSQNLISVASIDANAEEVSAGAQNLASFTISRNFTSLTPNVVNYTITGSAVQNVDYNLVANGTVNLTIAEPSVTFEITAIVDDELVEGLEDIVVTLVSESGPGSIDPANDEVIIEIADNDEGIINFSFDEVILNPYIPEAFEGGDEGQFRLESDKMNATGSTVLLFFEISGTAGPAGQGSSFDYDLSGAINVANNRITYANNSQFRVVNVEPFDDAIAEPDKTVTIKLTGTNNPLFTIGPLDTATVTIIDDDCSAGDTPPPLNNATAMARCDVNSVNLNTFITGGAASAPAGTALRWSLIANPTASGDLITATATTSNTYYGVYWDNVESCASPATQVDLVLSESPDAGDDANGAACNNPDDSFGATLIDLDDLLTAGVDPGTWSFISGPETIAPNPNNRIQFRNRTAGTYRYSYTTNNAVAPCTNDSATFTITVTDCDPCVAGNSAPVLANDVETTQCDTFESSFNDYTNSTPPANTTLVWSTDSDPSNTNAHLTAAEANNPPTLAGTYYGFFYDAVNNCGSPVLQIDLVLNDTPTLTNTDGDVRCGAGTVVLTATASANATINWYSSASGGSVIGTGNSFTTPFISETTSYYVLATLNSCATERVEVEAEVVPQPSAGTAQNGGNASSCSDASNGPTSLILSDLLTGEDEGDWVYNNGPTANFTIAANNEVDFEGMPDGNYVFTFTTTGAQAPCENESSVITISVNDCDVDTDLDGIFDGPESILGTNPNSQDTDEDGVNDGLEVGDDLENPLDADQDGIIDALESILADADNDGVVDQLDPANDNPCVPNTLNGVCDSDGDDIADSDEDANGDGVVDEGESDPNDPCDPNSEHPNCNPDPIDIEVLKTVDNINGLIGETVVFTVTVNNTDAERDARDILIGDLLESGFEYQMHEPLAAEYDDVNGEWFIPFIEAGGSESIDISVMILEDGVYDNTAELLDSFPMDVTPENNSATVTLPIMVPEGVNLVLEKRVSLGLDKEKLDVVTGLINTIDTEVEVFYFIKVINKSQQDPVSNIRVIDVFTNEEDVDFEITETTVPAGTTFNAETGVWLIDEVSLPREAEIELSYRVVFKGTGTVFNTASIDRSTPRESLDKDQDPDSSDTATVVITTRNEIEVGILYNQFSPNNDGLNDNLKINTIRTNEDGTQVQLDVLYSIQIFNRYGSLVFETEQQTTDEIWDGSWKGKDSPDGTYFYTLNVQIEGEGASIQKGWIQLIR